MCRLTCEAQARFAVLHGTPEPYVLYAPGFRSGVVNGLPKYDPDLSKVTLSQSDLAHTTAATPKEFKLIQALESL